MIIDDQYKYSINFNAEIINRVRASVTIPM